MLRDEEELDESFAFIEEDSAKSSSADPLLARLEAYFSSPLSIFSSSLSSSLNMLRRLEKESSVLELRPAEPWSWYEGSC